jgi:MraZ protein
MQVLFGKYRHAVDSKGRISIPLRLRDRFIIDGSRRLALLEGFEGCLYCYPWNEFRRILERLSRLAFDRTDARKLLRWLSKHGTEIELDSQGRIQLSDEQRKAAGIEGDALLVGVGSRLEIWADDRFSAATRKTDGASLAEGILSDLPTTAPAARE